MDRPAFFARLNEGEAVPYFYEPFLEAFDPDLHKQLGVWYTLTEVVRMDRALIDDLGISDGVACTSQATAFRLVFGTLARQDDGLIQEGGLLIVSVRWSSLAVSDIRPREK